MPHVGDVIICAAQPGAQITDNNSGTTGVCLLAQSGSVGLLSAYCRGRIVGGLWGGPVRTCRSSAHSTWAQHTTIGSSCAAVARYQQSRANPPTSAASSCCVLLSFSHLCCAFCKFSMTFTAHALLILACMLKQLHAATFAIVMEVRGRLPACNWVLSKDPF